MRKVRTYKVKARPHWNAWKKKSRKTKTDTIKAKSQFDAELAFKNKHGKNWKVIAVEELCDKTKK